MVAEQGGSPTTFEFPRDYSSVMEKVEPILRRPMVFHSLVVLPGLGGFEELLRGTADILSRGLCSGKLTGKSDNEFVQFEVCRTRDRFFPSAKSMAVYPKLYSDFLNYLQYMSIEEATAKLGLNKGVSFLVDREAVEEIDLMEGRGKTFGSVPQEFIKGVVLLSQPADSEFAPLRLESEAIQQLRLDAVARLEQLSESPWETIEEVLNIKSDLQDFTLDDDWETVDFLTRFLAPRHRKLAQEAAAALKGEFVETQSIALSVIQGSSDVNRIINQFRKETEAIGRVYAGIYYYGLTLDQTAKAYGINKEDLASRPLLSSWMKSFILLMLVKIYQRKSEIESLLSEDNSDVNFSLGLTENEVEKIIQIVSKGSMPLPVYDDRGNLVWPEEMSFEEILDRYMRHHSDIRIE